MSIFFDDDILHCFISVYFNLFTRKINEEEKAWREGTPLTGGWWRLKGTPF